jgi:hypothetical protein
MARILDEPITWIVETVVAIVAFVLAIALGVLIPGLAAMRLLHIGGWIGQGPEAPGLLWDAIRYTLIAAAALVLAGRILGLERHGLFVGSYIAMLFAYSFLIPLLFSGIVMMAVHVVVSPLFGIDAWREWRPLLHVAFAVGGAVMALRMHFDERGDFYEDGASGYRGPRYHRPRYRGPRHRGSVGTAAMTSGTLLGGLTSPSGDSAGGSWSDDSGGGDSD